MNESECQTVDWRQLGDLDGGQGHEQTRLAKHAKACDKHGIAINQVAYNEGWRLGIGRYCTPQNGYNIGRQRGSYRGSCPSDLAPAFLAAYNPSLRVANAEHRVRLVQQDIDHAINNIARWAGSKDPELLEKLPDERIKLNNARAELPLARS
ncbi:MAG: DUF2799 domain-containing protein, partial [Pseudomonadota bacterium]